MKSVLVAFALLSASFAAAADFAAPRLTGPVVDEVGLLSPSEQTKIESLLRAMNAQGAEKGIQMNVVIPKSLQGLEIEQYGIRLAEAWKLGQAKTDRGLILIVAPEERAMRLEVGYGLEGELPDARAKQILDDTLKPFFRASRFGDGVIAAVYEISERTGIDLSSASVAKPERRSANRRVGGGFGGDIWKLFLFLAFFAGIKRLAVVLGGGALGYFAATLTGIFAPTLGLMIGAIGGLILGLMFIRGGISAGDVFMAGRGSRMSRGGFGGFGGGGSWGGGGGGFGGGGASSRW